MWIKRLAELYDRLVAALAFVGALLMGGMALWVTYEVLMRYFLERPTFWAVDLSEYAMLWAAFLAAPWVLRRGRHVSIELVVIRLGFKAQHTLGVATSLVGAAICAVMAWQGAFTVWDFYLRGVNFAREWQIPQHTVYLAIPLGSALLVVEFLLGAVRSLRAARREATFLERAAEERTI